MAMAPVRLLRRNDGGFVLPATVLFVFVLMIATMGFSALVGYETRGALYRQSSTAAFYLAEAAVERARARLLSDGGWRGELAGVPEGSGSYDLVVRDTTLGQPGATVRIVGTGHAQRSNRRIELLARIEPTAFRHPLFVAGDAQVSGNLCLRGQALVTGDAYGATPAQPPQFTCGGGYLERFAAAPPPVFTEPARYPGATYYFVRGSSTAPPQARIYDASGADITGSADFSDVLTYAGGVFRFSFDTPAKIAKYFDPATGVFPRSAPDSCVVVNFGEAPTVDPPGAAGIAELSFAGTGLGVTVETTLINARFVGVSASQRTDPLFWRGGMVSFQRCTLAPRGGIGLLGGRLECPAGANVHLGTASRPALLYLTGGVGAWSGNATLTGCLVSLGSFRSGGGTSISHDSGFIARLPAWLQQGVAGASGTARVIRWAEVGASSS